MTEAGFQPNPQLLESMLVFTAVEQTPGVLADQQKAAHQVKLYGETRQDRVNAEIEWGRLHAEIERARQIKPELQNNFVEQIDQCSDFSVFERVIYRNALSIRGNERQDFANQFLPHLVELDEAAQEGARVFLDVYEFGPDLRYKILGTIAEAGVKVRNKNEVGLTILGARITPGGVYGYDGAIKLVDEPTFVHLADFRNGGQSLPSVGQSDDQMAIGQQEYQKYLADMNEEKRRGRNLFVAGLLTGLAVDVQNPYSSEQQAEIKEHIIDGIESQARAKTLATSKTLVLNQPGYRDQDILSVATSTPTIIRKLSELTGLIRVEAEEIINQKITNEREEILEGMRTGETWPELEIVQQRLHRVITIIFGVHDRLSAVRVDEVQK